MFFELAVLISCCYSLVLLWLIVGLLRLSRSRYSDQPFVSVIVAARNEEQNISGLLDALKAQYYNPDDYEILIIDDQSTDKTYELARAAGVRVFQTQKRDRVISPKKEALELGIHHAKGDIILLTDADCRPQPAWLHTMASYFTSETGMVIGFAPYEFPHIHTLSQSLQALESLSLAAVAAGSAGMGYPATCTGRNLAYRKEVYKKVGGFESIKHFVSGDDDLLMSKIRHTHWKIRYADSPNAVVSTLFLKHTKQFIRQRLRHSSKSLNYDVKEIAGLVAAYLFNVFFFISLPLVILEFWPVVCLLPLGIKIALDWILCFLFAHRMHRKAFLWSFVLAQVLHIPYVVIFGVLGPFSTIKWKE